MIPSPIPAASPGRTAARERLAAHLTTHASPLVLLQGGTGIGKTTFLQRVAEHCGLRSIEVATTVIPGIAPDTAQKATQKPAPEIAPAPQPGTNQGTNPATNPETTPTLTLRILAEDPTLDVSGAVRALLELARRRSPAALTPALTPAPAPAPAPAPLSPPSSPAPPLMTMPTPIPMPLAPPTGILPTPPLAGLTPPPPTPSPLLFVEHADFLDERSVEVLRRLIRTEQVAVALCSAGTRPAQLFAHELAATAGLRLTVPPLGDADLVALVQETTHARPSTPVVRYLADVSAGRAVGAIAALQQGDDEGWLATIDDTLVFAGTPGYTEAVAALTPAAWGLPLLGDAARDLLYRIALLGPLSARDAHADPRDDDALAQLEALGLITVTGGATHLICRALRFTLECSMPEWPRAAADRAALWDESSADHHPERSVFAAHRAGIVCTDPELSTGIYLAISLGLLERAAELLTVLSPDYGGRTMLLAMLALQAGRPKEALNLLSVDTALAAAHPRRADEALRFSAYIRLTSFQSAPQARALLLRAAALRAEHTTRRVRTATEALLAAQETDPDPDAVVDLTLELMAVWYEAGPQAVLQICADPPPLHPFPGRRDAQTAQMHLAVLLANAHAGIGDFAAAMRLLSSMQLSVTDQVPGYAQEWLRVMVLLTLATVGVPAADLPGSDWLHVHDERVVPGLSSLQMVQTAADYSRGVPLPRVRTDLADAYRQLHSGAPLRRRVRSSLELLGLLVGMRQYADLVDPDATSVGEIGADFLDPATARYLPLATLVTTPLPDLHAALLAGSDHPPLLLVPAARIIALRRGSELADDTIELLVALLERSPSDAALAAVLRARLCGDETALDRAVAMLRAEPGFLCGDGVAILHAAWKRADEERQSGPAAGAAFGLRPRAGSAGTSPSPTIPSRFAESFQRRLSAREQEIALLVCDGLRSEGIAAHLSISVRTVETHLHNVYRKLGVHSRHELWAEVIA